MGPSRMFALNCALAAAVVALICGSPFLPINTVYAFFGLSMAGLVLALRKAGRTAGGEGGAESPLRRFLFTQAVVAALAFQVAMVITVWNVVWDDQAWPPLFALGATALAVNLLLRIGSVARLRSPRRTIAALAFTGAAAAALLWAVREYYAFYLIYILRRRNKPARVRGKTPLLRRDVHSLRPDGPVGVPRGLQPVQHTAVGVVGRGRGRGLAPTPLVCYT